MAGGHWLNSPLAVYWIPGYWLDVAAASYWSKGQIMAGPVTTPVITDARAVKNVTSRLLDEAAEPGSSSIVFGP